MPDSHKLSAPNVGCQQEYDRRDLEAMSVGHNYRRWILDQFVPYLGKDVVEVGAGSGDFSKLLLERGIRSLTAVEPAANMYPILRTALAAFENARVSQGRLQDVLSQLKTRPDTITYISVLEHILDDGKELEQAFEVLIPGGVIWIFVPALTWLYGTNDVAVGHFRRYEKEPLSKLVETAGFQIVKSRYIDFFGIIPWFVLFRLFKQAAVHSNQVSVYDRFCVPICRYLEHSIRFPIGKNLLIVGRKPPKDFPWHIGL